MKILEIPLDLRTAVAAGLLVAVPAASGYALATLHSNRQQADRTRQVRQLEQRTAELSGELEEAREDARRAAQLAERRCEDLESRLLRYQAELREAWARLGDLPRPEESRRPMASRGATGMRRVERVRVRLRGLENQVHEGRRDLRELQAAVRAHLKVEALARARHTPSGRPCKAEMTSGFGPRLHPVYGFHRPHNGCDFTTDEGTVIRATGDGTVTRADWLGGYGQVVEIDHGYGLETLYAHCRSLKVRKGQQVHRGDPIATVGMTGLASGPHCHYEVHYRGRAVDPAAFLGPTTPPSPWTRLQRILQVPLGN